MKKYLLSLTTLALLLCEASFSGGGMAFAGNNVGDTFDYDSKYTCTIITTAPTNLFGKPTSNGTVSIKAKSGATLPGALSIPSTTSFSGTIYTFSYDVVTIEANGFKGKTSITSLTIPNSVTTLNSSAFEGCTNLASVSLGSGVTSLPSSIFKGCTSLTKVGSTNGVITIPNAITSLGSSAFEGCTALTSVTLGSGVTSLPSSIFKGCTSLTKIGSTAGVVTIPSGVTSIGSSAFEGCTSLAAITFSGTSVTSWPSSMCKGCTSLTKIGSTNNRITVYSAVTSIGSSAFEGCTSITSVLFSGTSVTSFASNVFKGCTSLTQMGSTSGTFIIPNYVTTINSSAFANCTGITKLTIGTGVTTLYSAAFTGCSNITTVTWNATNCTSSYTTSDNPFSASKSNITSFTFGTSVQKVPAYLCYQMSEIQSITIPQTVTNMGNGVFLGCSKLTNVIWNAANCADFTKSSGSVPTYSTPFCVWTVSGSPSRAENITSITFGSNVTKVPAYLCFNCPNLKVVIWEAGSATIGTGAFGSCSNLKSIIWNKTNCADFASASATPFYSIRTQIESFTFKNNVTLIPAYLCDGMTNLKQVSLPSTVTTVGANAFNGCTGMEVFACAKATAPTASSNSFNNVPCCLTVYADAWDSYKDATGWSHFNNAGCSNAPSSIVRGTCGAQGKNLVWELNLTSGEMTISGTGAMADYSSSGNTSPWYEYRTLISHLTLSNGITSIGSYAFYGCSELTEFAIPESLTSIGAHAYHNCSGLPSTITVPEQITFMGDMVFTGCPVTAVVWNAINYTSTNLTTSVNPFFSNRSSIVSFTFGENVEHIPANLCYNMSNASFTSVSIPASVTSMGGGVFNNCSKLQTIYSYPATAPTIGAGSSMFHTDVNNNATLFIPMDGYASYIAEATWNNITHKTVYGECGISGDNLTCELELPSGTLTISGTGSMADYDYTSNPAPWASMVSEISNLVIEEGVTTIGKHAFYANYSFTEISFPVSLEESKTASFATINGPTRVNYAGTLAQWCDVKLGALSSTPMNYGTPSFYANGTQILGTVTVPVGVETIKGYTLINLGITNLYLPSTLDSIGSNAFDKNTGSLTNIYYAGSAANWCGVRVASSTSHPLYVAKERNPQLYCEGVKPTSVVVPAGVKSLNDYHFYNCQELTSVTISEDITAIGANTFKNCSKLATIVWNATNCPNFNGTSYAPFYNIRSQITSITFGSSVQNVPGYLCYGMNNASLTSISIPNSVQSIGNYAFRDCSHLTTFTIGEASLATMGYNVFENCTALTAIHIPNSLTALPKETFMGCSALASVTYGDNPSLATIGQYAFKNCTSLTSITIPASITSIDCNAGQSQIKSPFYGCSSLNTVIWNAANCSNFMYAYYNGNSHNYYTPFYNEFTHITSFTFGNTVEHIPNYLCYGMTGLTEITIPGSVTSIGASAFMNCMNITSVTTNAESVPSISSNTFPSEVESSATLTVPYNPTSRRAYSADSYWSEFATIYPYILTFNMKGHGDPIDEMCVGAGRVDEELKPTDPTEDYYNFGGWYQEAGCSTPFTFGESGTAVNADKTIYAKWTIYNYQVTFNMQGHGSAIASQTIDHNGLVSEPSAPSEVGYTFGGWFKEAGCVNEWDFSNDHVTTATTLFAKWTIISYDVTFDLQGHGDAIDAQSVNYNGLVSQPSAPSEVGYTFGGWFKEPACSNAWDFSNDHVTEATTLYALWTINSYEVTFDLQGHGSDIAAQSINYNGLVSQPSAPSAEYYTFGGWYKEAGCNTAWNFSEDKVTDDLILYAKWTRADLSLNDDADNSDALTEYDEEMTNVHLTRSIISASYNTICLPFAMTAAQVETYFGAECDIEELTKASFADGNLKLFFTKRTAIEAGKPYLIQPQSDVANPTIADVTIDNTSRPSEFEGVTFTGTFSPTFLANSDNLLFLGASNTLYMSSGGTMKGMRGYFQLTTPQAQAAARRSARIVFHEEVATGIETVESQESKVESTKIMRGGQLLIIRDGKTYNAQGALIK